MFNPKRPWLVAHKAMLLRIPYQQSCGSASEMSTSSHTAISFRRIRRYLSKSSLDECGRYALFSDIFCLDDASASRPDLPPTTSVELLRVHSSLSQKSIRHGEVPGLTKILLSAREIDKIACIACFFLDIATE